MSPSARFPTGDFEIYYFTVVGQSKKVTLRPLGVGKNNEIVILPVGSKPQKWNLEKLNDGSDSYRFTIKGRCVTIRNEDYHLILSDKRPSNDYCNFWIIYETLTVSPPPVGRDTYRVYYNPPAISKAWTIPAKVKDGEQPNQTSITRPLSEQTSVSKDTSMPPADYYPFGAYEIYNFTVSGQSNKVTLRPLGIGKNNTLVVLPVGSKAPKWMVERRYDGNYRLLVGGRAVMPVFTGKPLVLSNTDDNVYYSWLVFGTGTSSPAPVGRDTYSVTSSTRNQFLGWTVPEKLKDGEEPVIYGKDTDAARLYFKRVAW
ncbi:hypothetical protein CVT24_011237 [Panaeolus cyanescens]|uniref:Uncharacterized protein n=1 Tax=Panaeolus cyanescens TaxID=181874 RepID=A0A409YGG1_9AGAR|nr:hypothetical protein CVT24_011237 [Panaeolus cyanescens]